MNIVVLVKQVPDTAALIQIDADRAGILTEDVKWVINPYDEFGIEEALRIRGRQGGGKVTVLSVGPMSAVASIRAAFAMGIDEGILICDPALEKADALLTAKVLAAALRQIPFDLIIAGHRAVDDDCCLAPSAVSEQLGIPLLSMVVRETIENGRICCDQYFQDRVSRVEADLPVLMTTQRGLNEPRLPTLATILKAKRAQVQVKTLADIGISADEAGPDRLKMKILSLAYPPPRKAGKIVDGSTPGEKASRLASLLQEAGLL